MAGGIIYILETCLVCTSSSETMIFNDWLVKPTWIISPGPEYGWDTPMVYKSMDSYI